MCDGQHAQIGLLHLLNSKLAVPAPRLQLYPLDRGFFYVHKPPLLIPDNDIESVEFGRQGSGGVSSSVRTFDLFVRVKGGTEHQFRCAGATVHAHHLHTGGVELAGREAGRYTAC